MSGSSDLKEFFARTADSIERAFEAAGVETGEQVSPPQLIDAIGQLLDVLERLDEQYGESGAILSDDPSQLGDYAIGFLSDLGVWADRLNHRELRVDLDKVALGVAHWIVRHDGEIRTLEPVVNALAASANQTHEPAMLEILNRMMSEVIDHASPAIKSDLEKSDPARPWRILNFNYAIVATRTQKRELMEKAFDTLTRNLPEDAATFFEEGLKQAEKDVYGAEVKALMQEYFNKWTTRH